MLTSNPVPSFTRSRSGSVCSLELTSDAVDQVNVLNAKFVNNNSNGPECVSMPEEDESSWNGASAFDQDKDMTRFRQYVEAKDSVKAFYAVRPLTPSLFHIPATFFFLSHHPLSS